MTIHGRFDGLRLGRCGLWNLIRTGLKTGHYRGSLIWLLVGPLGFARGKREAVVVVLVDGVADGSAPGVGAEGVDLFVLGEVDGLYESLRQVGDGVSGPGFYVAADDGGDEASEGGAEIAGGEVVAGEEVVEVFAEGIGGAGSSFFLGVVEAEVAILGGARSAALAAIGKGESAQTGTVLLRCGRRADSFRCGPDQVGANRVASGHGSLQKS
jgi:hypothetical protein